MQGHEKYRLNESIIIDTLSNEIFMDPEVGQGEKIEPRIMSVLKILLDNSPEVVTREYLVTHVWNGYPGADDALNQAISHLRHLLNDKDKNNRLIETVVKKGYRFRGKVTIINKRGIHQQDKPKEAETKNQTIKRYWILLLLITILILLLLIFYSIYLIPGEATAPSPPNRPY